MKRFAQLLRTQKPPTHKKQRESAKKTVWEERKGWIVVAERSTREPTSMIVGMYQRERERGGEKKG